MIINIIEGGVTAAKGFKAAGYAAGIKKNTDKMDMAMIMSSVPCVCAGTFTSNVVKAAPVIWDRERVMSGAPSQVVVVNSGIANACTGEEGMAYCRKTAEAVAQKLIVSPESVLIGSTGVIGAQLPMDRIEDGISHLADMLDGSMESGTKAAQAIMTTDTVEKQTAVTFTLSDGTVATLGGCCKGSGMIHPNMCTMLSFLTTDVSISKDLLQEALSEDIKDTYNMISVDGDTSTNDTVLLLSNGLAGNKMICERDADYQLFREVLHEVNLYLAKQIAADGEGATALFSCRVLHASCKEDARKLARSVVSSTLTKAAIAGHDANWGRILCALGYSGAVFEPEMIDVMIESRAGKLKIVGQGVAEKYSEEEATRILSENDITITADMNAGAAEATAWGCDLTHKYVDINADYRS